MVVGSQGNKMIPFIRGLVTSIALDHSQKVDSNIQLIFQCQDCYNLLVGYIGLVSDFKMVLQLSSICAYEV